MKKLILLMVCLLAAVGLRAQSFRLELADDIPSSAAQVLSQRFTQMLEGGGLTVADDGAPLRVTARVASREVTLGSLGQVALEIELTATAGEVSDTFNIKGVGDSDADAWQRAVKMLLPRSKTAHQFVEKLK